MYISTVTLLVKDVDRAIDFYTKKLGWEKTMDAPMGDGTRPMRKRRSIWLSDGLIVRTPRLGGQAA
jgi:catechol 2,3-dioxygenase-like lactoylglutathione lyase family enzyme